MQKWGIFYQLFCFGLLFCCLYHNLCLTMFYYDKPKIKNHFSDYRFKTYAQATMCKGYKRANCVMVWRRHSCSWGNLRRLLKIQNSLLKQRVYNSYFKINLKKSALSSHYIKAVKIIIQVVCKENWNFTQVWRIVMML